MTDSAPTTRSPAELHVGEIVAFQYPVTGGRYLARIERLPHNEGGPYLARIHGFANGVEHAEAGELATVWPEWATRLSTDAAVQPHPDALVTMTGGEPC